jgi:hypothetical protein
LKNAELLAKAQNSSWDALEAEFENPLIDLLTLPLLLAPTITAEEASGQQAAGLVELLNRLKLQPQIEAPAAAGLDPANFADDNRMRNGAAAELAVLNLYTPPPEEQLPTVPNLKAAEVIPILAEIFSNVTSSVSVPDLLH